VIKAKLQGVKSTILSSTSILFTLPIGLTYLLYDGYFFKLMDSPEIQNSSFYIIILGTLGTGIALMMFYKLVEISNPITASTVTYFIPIIAILWGVLDGETLYPAHFICMSIILGGVYLVNRSKP
jgi:drug/metabolite transporter (DMT)-like permease